MCEQKERKTTLSFRHLLLYHELRRQRTPRRAERRQACVKQGLIARAQCGEEEIEVQGGGRQQAGVEGGGGEWEGMSSGGRRRGGGGWIKEDMWDAAGMR